AAKRSRGFDSCVLGEVWVAVSSGSAWYNPYAYIHTVRNWAWCDSRMVGRPLSSAGISDAPRRAWPAPAPLRSLDGLTNRIHSIQHTVLLKSSINNNTSGLVILGLVKFA